MKQVASCIPNSEIQGIVNTFNPSNLSQPEVFKEKSITGKKRINNIVQEVQLIGFK
ncbi:hypothetical protein [Peribacillus butanolivorans]|uniref:hypothetical protein n=1 Tax=Peribacillus butanolivorans TaxID=421767 RepID=UPI00368FC896